MLREVGGCGGGGGGEEQEGQVTGKTKQVRMKLTSYDMSEC